MGASGVEITAASASSSAASVSPSAKRRFLSTARQPTTCNPAPWLTRLVMHHAAADAELAAQRGGGQRGPILGLQTRIHAAARVAVHARRAVVRHAHDRNVVARPVDALDVARVVVQTHVLRAVDAPDDDVRVRPAADQELACGAPADVVDVHRVAAGVKGGKGAYRMIFFSKQFSLVISHQL